MTLLTAPSSSAISSPTVVGTAAASARGATKVYVRWTQVRHLRKPRKGPKGQVILRQAQTKLADPVDPERLFDGDNTQ